MESGIFIIFEDSLVGPDKIFGKLQKTSVKTNITAGTLSMYDFFFNSPFSFRRTNYTHAFSKKLLEQSFIRFNKKRNIENQ